MPPLVYLLVVGAFFFLSGCGESPQIDDPAPAGLPNSSIQETLEKSSRSELVNYTEEREPCDNRNPNRNAYFGDLHIHTAYSYDARPLGARTTPADAYRYARGEEISLPPYDEGNQPFGIQKIDRPLDFAAVTDHAEFLGEISLCADESSENYNSKTCQQFRKGGTEGVLIFVRGLSKKPRAERNPDLCGDDAADKTHYKVIDVAGDDGSGGTIDLETGVWSGRGRSSLCTVFEDPEFDANQPSYYYMRAVEVPSLRWSWRQCVELPPSDRPPECENDAPKVTQELAWTSPVWYLPKEL
jgi:hypothetical protein